MDEATFYAFGTLVGNLGFPVVLSAYLMVRFENKLTKLTSVIEDLKNFLEKKN